MALEVGIVGPSGSGKTSLFTALTKAGGGEYGKTNVGVAPIADDRLGALAEVVKAPQGHAGDDPRAGRPRLGRRAARQPAPGRRAARRRCAASAPTPTPDDDLETFKLELLVADRDHVERRLERVEKQAKSGDAKVRAEARRAAEGARARRGGRRARRSIAGELPGELEPLTTKPLLAVVNGPGGIDLKLEAELAELPDEEAEAYRDGGASALDEIVRRLHDALDLITFFTAGEQETRAWTLRNGETALDAAGAIHSDIARGFIRCEVVDWQRPRRAGSHAEVAKHGRQRLEGKTYVVRDGDVLNIRFNV